MSSADLEDRRYPKITIQFLHLHYSEVFIVLNIYDIFFKIKSSICKIHVDGTYLNQKCLLSTVAKKCSVRIIIK